MYSAERLRTFVAVYRAGSVTQGARHRAISQPAASQQLTALERDVGGSLFSRTAGGVRPTARGRELYGQVAAPLDRLEPVLRGLDGGRPALVPSAVRVATTAEYFATRVVPKLDLVGAEVSASFGDEQAVVGLLEQGAVDVALTSLAPGRRPMAVTPLPDERFVLVVAPAQGPALPLPTPADAAAWLSGRPWVAYSHELPVTRRFWQRVLGRPFAGDLRLIAPDLRVVADAVVAGLGASLLPTYVVDDLLARGAVTEVLEVAGLVPAQPWFALTAADGARPEVAGVVQALASEPGP